MGNEADLFGSQVRQLRQEKQMSQEELAFKAGLSPAHLGQIERGLKMPTIETAGKIADGLELPLGDLFVQRQVPVSVDNVTIQKIQAHLISMSPEEQKDILKIIRIFKKQGKERVENG